MLQAETVTNRIQQELLFQAGGEPAALITFFMRLTCRSVGKIGKKCLHLGGFDDKITLLQYAQNRGIIGR